MERHQGAVGMALKLQVVTVGSLVQVWLRLGRYVTVIHVTFASLKCENDRMYWS